MSLFLIAKNKIKKSWNNTCLKPLNVYMKNIKQTKWSKCSIVLLPNVGMI